MRQTAECSSTFIVPIMSVVTHNYLLLCSLFPRTPGSLYRSRGNFIKSTNLCQVELLQFLQNYISYSPFLLLIICINKRLQNLISSLQFDIVLHQNPELGMCFIYQVFIDETFQCSNTIVLIIRNAVIGYDAMFQNESNE